MISYHIISYHSLGCGKAAPQTPSGKGRKNFSGSFVPEKMMYFLAKHLVYTENYLNHGKEFIYGDKYTAADCLLTVLLHRVNEMRFYDVFDGKILPNISKYWSMVSSRPSYKEAIIDYETGEWKPELVALYGDGANTFSGLLENNINNILNKEN